jgi:hypothetical protein
MIKKLKLQQNLLGLISAIVDHPPAPHCSPRSALPKTYRNNYFVCNIYIIVLFFKQLSLSKFP